MHGTALLQRFGPSLMLTPRDGCAGLSQAGQPAAMVEKSAACNGQSQLCGRQEPQSALWRHTALGAATCCSGTARQALTAVCVCSSKHVHIACQISFFSGSQPPFLQEQATTAPPYQDQTFDKHTRCVHQYTTAQAAGAKHTCLEPYR